MKAPKNHRTSWTPENVSVLKKLGDGNTPTRLIALKLGRSEGSVQNKASQIQLSLKPVNQSPYNRRQK
jgi:DNA-binding NarL/FixJ family response regulator